MRRTGLLLLAAALCSLAPDAHAQPTGDTTGQQTSTWQKSDFAFRLKRQSSDRMSFEDLNPSDYELFFNRARCECKEPVELWVQLTSAGLQKATLIDKETIEVWVGPTNCVAGDATLRNTAGCRRVLEPTMLANLTKGTGQRITLSTDLLFSVMGTGAAAGCSADLKQAIWIMLRPQSSAEPSLTNDNAPRLELNLDGQAPPPPQNVRVTGGNEALEVKWDALTGKDYEGFVVFCGRGSPPVPVYKDSYYDRKFHTAGTRCGSAPQTTTRPQLTFATTRDAEDGELVTSPDSFFNLDVAYACSELISAGTSKRLGGLQNGIPYLVGVASVDENGNASPIEEAVMQIPIPTRDFYRGYREAGGDAEGGYCAFTRRGRGSAALVVGAAALALLAVRRRRRAR